VSKRIIELTGGKARKIVSLHLGNGASATAVFNGKSVAHSMGFGPLAGLVMGTRSGDIDPSVLLYWGQNSGMSFDEISRILNKESGLKALAGHNDMREVEKLYLAGDSAAEIAIEMYSRRIKKYIGAFAAVMNGLDALIFTGGIGENSALIREKVTEDMDFAGIRLDKDANRKPGRAGGKAVPVHTSGAPVEIWVVPTDEEKEIAVQTYQTLHE
jgi:acetate kinase